MARVGYNPKTGKIKTDARTTIDRAFIAHVEIPAPAAADTTSIISGAPMGAAASAVVSGIGTPDYPRNLKIVCNKSGITSAVKVTGLNCVGETITESKALNGTTPATLSKPFSAITKIDLPAQTNTPAKQKATVEVTQGAQAAGETVFTFVSAATGAAYDITVEYAAAGTEAQAAAILAAALNDDAKFKASWSAKAASAVISIESLDYADQDATVNLTVKTAGTSAITLGSIVVGAVSGVDADRVSIGIGKSFGLPYKLDSADLVVRALFNKALENTAGVVAVNGTDIAGNTFTPNGTPDGAKDIDLYILV